MSATLCIAGMELRIACRNMWVATAIVVAVLFATVLAGVGDSTSEALDTDRLGVVISGLTTLSVYFVPLIALLVAFDAISGERERGTLALMFSYPIGRGQFLLGKFVAHLAVLGIAIGAGFLVAGCVTAIGQGVSAASLYAMVRLYISALALGATFLAVGYVVSALTRFSSAASGIAIGLWIVVVVLYDLALLAGLVLDNGGVFTTSLFPWLLAANPADAFRTYNLLASDLAEGASGLIGTLESTPAWLTGASLIVWPVVALGVAWRIIIRREP